MADNQKPGGPEPEAAPSLYRKILAVMAEVGFIEKEEAKGKGLQYDYISHDAVAAALRPALIKHGIVVHPTVDDHEKDGNRTELKVNVTFINADLPEDRLTVHSVGYGVDNQDKGPGKAMSYAVKYACMKLFMLNSADDIENSSVEHDRSTKADVDAAEKDRGKAILAALDTFKDSLNRCKTEEDVDTLQNTNKKLLQAVDPETRALIIELIQTTKDSLNVG